MMTSPSGEASLFTAFTRGGERATPMSSFPCIKPIGPAIPFSTDPIARFFTVIADSGHASQHPPHPWQSSGKTMAFLISTAMALNRQAAEHFAQ